MTGIATKREHQLPGGFIPRCGFTFPKITPSLKLGALFFDECPHRLIAFQKRLIVGVGSKLFHLVRAFLRLRQ